MSAEGSGSCATADEHRIDIERGSTCKKVLPCSSSRGVFGNAVDIAFGLLHDEDEDPDAEGSADRPKGAAEDGITSLMRAARSGRVDLVKLLLGRGVEVNASDEFSNTGLMTAARNGHLQVVQELLARGADVNAADEFGLTSLMGAARGGYLDVVQLLVERGADPKATAQFGVTSLLIASEMGHAEVVRALLEYGADVSPANQFGLTSLMTAAERGHAKVVELLLEQGADVNATDGLAKTTSLMRAARHGHLPVVKLLLEDGAQVDAADRGGVSSLMLAAEHRHTEVARLLLGYEADVNAVAHTGMTSLTFAVAGGCIDIVELLLQHGADVAELARIQTSETQAGGAPLSARQSALLEYFLKSGTGGGLKALCMEMTSKAYRGPLPSPEVLCFICRLMITAGQDLLCSCVVADLLPRSISSGWPGVCKTLEEHLELLVKDLEACNPRLLAQLIQSTPVAPFTRSETERAAAACLTLEASSAGGLPLFGLSFGGGPGRFNASVPLLPIAYSRHSDWWSLQMEHQAHGPSAVEGIYRTPTELAKVDRLARSALADMVSKVLMAAWTSLTDGLGMQLRRRVGIPDDTRAFFANITQDGVWQAHRLVSLALALVHMGPTGLCAAAVTGCLWALLLLLLQPLVLGVVLLWKLALLLFLAFPAALLKSRRPELWAQLMGTGSTVAASNGEGGGPRVLSFGPSGSTSLTKSPQAPRERYTVSLSEVRLPAASGMLRAEALAKLLADPRVDPKLWTSPAFQAMLELQWLLFTRHVVFGVFLIRLAYTALFVTYALSLHRAPGTSSAEPQDDEHYRVRPVGLQMHCMIALAIITFEYALAMGRQVVASGLFQWLSHPWNLFDCAQISLMISILILHWSCSVPIEVLRGLSSVLVLITFWRLFGCTVATAGLGSLVRMVMEVSFDLRWFFIFLGVIFLGFGFALEVLAVDIAGTGGSTDVGVFVRLYTLIYSDFNSELLMDPDGSGNSWSGLATLAAIVCSIYMLFVTITLLNLLIAVISDAYDRVCKDQDIHRARSKAALIVETEMLLPSWFRSRRDRELFKCDTLLVMRNEFVSDADGSLDGPTAATSTPSWRGRLGEIQAIVATETNAMKSSLRDQAARLSKLEKQVTALVSGLDILLLANSAAGDVSGASGLSRAATRPRKSALIRRTTFSKSVLLKRSGD